MINYYTYNGFIGGKLMVKITDEEKETLSYGDVAYLILKDKKKKIKIQDLFKKVIDIMGLSETDYEDNIGNFFEIIITDKRFIMLDDGFCDLKINHSTKVIVEDDEDDYEIISDETDFDDEIDEDNYEEDATADDDADDDLQDLVILDENEEIDSDMI